MPAFDAGAGAEVDDQVGRAHRVFVMFNDDQRVAGVAQFDQRFDQAVVIVGMQADRRLVENVKHADQPAADLARQTNPL